MVVVVLDIKPMAEFCWGWLKMFCGVVVVLIEPDAVLNISDVEDVGSGILLLGVLVKTLLVLTALLLFLPGDSV